MQVDILEKAKKILKEPVCDNCLGRQFGQLLSGYDNTQRGKMLRTIVAMSADEEKGKSDLEMRNFSDYKFHNLVEGAAEKKKCSVCDGFFSEIEKYAGKIIKKAGKIDFFTFLIGTRLSHFLSEKEEKLWERVGIDYCEPLKAEINREIGKILEKKLGKKFNPKNPDVSFIIDIENKKALIEINPLFIYGEYQKLVRGIPQTKWPGRKYRTSVEQIIAKPLMAASLGKTHKFHGLGREDIDARCLGWRPFVLEIAKPKKRNIYLKKLAKKIDKRVKVRAIRFSNTNEVVAVKEKKSDKTYRALVVCEEKINKNEIKKLKNLIGEIRQRTPERVLHRRANKTRKRKVKEIKAVKKGKKMFLLTVRCEGGLYVKELISGDSGRTQPSVSSILNKQCRCKELDVINIHV
ncbi:MAG TPA: tRNA pseudouridine(54/55) synthase Pus10 [archaeon]|nr:tRNA pseudouridine(54/55) synthase Pus10 [archaeon]